jgi:hypothetical protein
VGQKEDVPTDLLNPEETTKKEDKEDSPPEQR